MADILSYTDYRKFIKDEIAELKKADQRCTYRYLAKQLEFTSPGYLTQIIQARSNISANLIQKFISLFNLKKREAKYFELMVLYNQAKSHDEKKIYFKKMILFKKRKIITVDSAAYEYYDRWFYSAIRAFLQFYPFYGDYKKLASTIVPAISTGQAKKAVSVLLKLGLIIKDETGRYTTVAQHLTTGENTDSVVINNFVLNTMDIAKDALYRFPKDQRSFSSLTLGVSKDGYQKIKKRVDDLRKELIDIVDNDKAVDRVCQVNFQLFPLTRLSGEEIK